MSVASSSPLEGEPRVFRNHEEATDFVFGSVARHASGGITELRIATPLGLGKPNELLNRIYRRAQADPSLKLTIFTALSLTPPAPKEDLARRFFGPFGERHWGKDYPVLGYSRDAVAGRLPPNVRVHEFYFQAGASLHSDGLQRAYQSVNYTHVAGSVFDAEIHAIVQLIARETDPATGEVRYSLASNPDLTLDVADAYRRAGRPFTVIGVVHPDLPFTEGEAAVPVSFFGAIVEDPSVRHELFALPRTPVGSMDHLIGFRASQLIRDGGTLQIGIGSLSDALVASLLFRHEDSAKYREVVEALDQVCGSSFGRKESTGSVLQPGTDPFREGLYGLSEMVMDGFMYLRQAGILTREVIDEASGERTFLHGAFFLGSKPFYSWIRSLRGKERQGMRMTRVSKVNDLYDPNELLLRRQRKHPRFVNTCMEATLLGGAASETLPNGRVVSGVGGQYNFVAMAHELPDARSILLLRATRESKGKRTSSIVWGHPQLTIPRHLRDIFITEYGIADLRNKSDEDCIRAMLAIADSEFQDELLETAKKNGKIATDYEIPAAHRRNTRDRVEEFVERQKILGRFKPFPFGSDFTPEEERLALALGKIQEAKDRSVLELAGMVIRGGPAHDCEAELRRMGIPASGGSPKERIYRRLLANALGRG